ncbi:MAG: hypothetical protein PWP45_1909 [Tepidanaerobacteraceae bacterium]|nr:hypothetical protein [Tepidanaerobacteraceae bacterium]
MARISKERRVTYYIGIGMIVLGFILFISVFFAAMSFMNDPSWGSESPPFMNSVRGMVLMIVGSIIMNIGYEQFYPNPQQKKISWVPSKKPHLVGCICRIGNDGHNHEHRKGA